MKKLIFLSALLFVFATSCRTNEGEIDPADRTGQTVIVEVFFLNSEGVESNPTGSAVWIFDDADFDLGAVSHFSMAERLGMTLTDGTHVLYHSYSMPPLGINRHVFENVPNGNHFIVINCFVQGSEPFARGYRRITVDQHIHEVVQRIVFTDDDFREQFPHVFWFIEK